VTGGAIADARLRRRFYGALDRARLERLRFHDLRHTFGTIAVQAFPLSDVKAMMGHADIATTMIYVHHVPQHDAADRLGRLFEAAEDPLEQNVSRTVSRTEPISDDLSRPDLAP
jgi:integrase